MGASRERPRAGGDRPVRPAHRIPGDADECPDGEVRRDEQRHRAHATAGMSASRDCRSRARQHHRRHLDTHRATKNANEPSRVATPMSIPCICRTATIQDAAASPSVAVNNAAVATDGIVIADNEVSWPGCMMQRDHTISTCIMQAQPCTLTCMLGRTYDSQVCSAARTLELVGERWTLLIVRNALFAGAIRYSDFRKDLGIATNILKTRLDGLVDAGIMERRSHSQNPAHYE